jgi:hypothetical protein
MVSVIELRVAASGVESLECIGKPLQRLQNRIFAQIRECQPDMTAMMERVFVMRVVLEAADEFFVAHRTSEERKWVEQGRWSRPLIGL